MSVATFRASVNRCTNAPSPMALFQTRIGEIDVVFADTIDVQSRIRARDIRYICTIERFTDQTVVLDIMRQAFNLEVK